MSARRTHVLAVVACVVAIPVIMFAVFVAVPNLLEGAL